jgi:hypothetical protein
MVMRSVFFSHVLVPMRVFLLGKSVACVAKFVQPLIALQTLMMQIFDVQRVLLLQRPLEFSERWRFLDQPFPIT